MLFTETMAEGSSSKTEAIYTTPSCPATPIDSYQHAQQGAHLPALVTHSTAGQAVLNLVDRIKNIGLGSVIGAVAPSSDQSKCNLWYMYILAHQNFIKFGFSTNFAEFLGLKFQYLYPIHTYFHLLIVLPL